MIELPTGNLTFLFTDIEGSTRLWEEYPEQMRVALQRHDTLMREQIEAHGGQVFKTIGDAFCAVFPDTVQCIKAALAAQGTLHWMSVNAEDSSLPLKVRFALHTGEAEARDGDYFGRTLNRVARLLSIGHGGQTLVSETTHAVVEGHLPAEVSLRDLGQHRLKDLQEPVYVWQLCHPELPDDFPKLRSLSLYENNLPRQFTSFIGREKEQKDIKSQLRTTRLLTLTGSGGTGKTRLALQVAADLLEEYPDGVWIVELAPLSDASLVPQAVATVLNLREEPGSPIMTTLLKHLKSKRLLLLLDNCEHLLTPAARLVDAILKSCTDVTLLASSREPLGVSGERNYRIPSLGLPKTRGAVDVTTVLQSEAVKLFTDRASAIKPDFAITSANARALASLCNRLDGIPLALELAAARVRALPVEQIESRLSDRFRLLTGGSRTALPRQQTLRALMDWSYDLLEETQKVLLGRFAVFNGGATLETLEQVCTGGLVEEWEVLDVLTALVDKSLVLYEEHPIVPRYRLLETVREYARQRLHESGEEAEFILRHRDHFLKVAEETAPHLRGPEASAALDQLETEHDNLRAALVTCREREDGGEVGLRLASALQTYWMIRGYLAEGLTHLLEALAHPGAQAATKIRGQALSGAGSLARMQSDYEQASAFHEQAIAIRREIGDQQGLAASLNNLGNVAQTQGHYERARALYEEALALNRQVGNRDWEANNRVNLGIIAQVQGDDDRARTMYEEALSLYRELSNTQGAAFALHNLGNIALERNSLDEAASHFNEALTIQRELGDRAGIALTLNSLGIVHRLREGYATARACQEESVTLSQEIGDRHGIAAALNELAELALSQEMTDRAVRLYSAMNALMHTIGAPLTPTERQRLDESLARCRADLGDAAFEVAAHAGLALTQEEAISFALAS